jgi:acyl-CoA synthetase
LRGVVRQTPTSSGTEGGQVNRLLTLHHPAEARRYYASGLWQEDTLYCLAARWASERGDAAALRDHHRRVTWFELVAEADRVAAALHQEGLLAGDRVSVWMSNRIEAIVIFLACSRNGYVFNTSLHATYGAGEVVTLLERVASRALFAEIGHGAAGSRDDIFTLAKALPSMRAVFSLPGYADTGAALPAQSYPAGTASGPAAPASDPDQIVYLAFTSGTTGAPKAVMHSDNTLLANARAMVADWGHGPDTVLLTLSQMSHHIGTVALCQALVGGFELVLNEAAAGLHPVDWLEKTAATYVMGVPTHAIDILTALSQRGQSRLGQVSVFYMAGAPIPRVTAQSLLNLGITPQNVYGMTENGSHQYTLPDDGVETITGTCGKACSAYEIGIFDQHDRNVPVATGETGEIGGRGAMRMLGYFDNQAATEGSFNAAGWFMSGDLGRVDAHGNLEIVGRSKDIIIRGGHNIHPAGIEDLAMRHPAISKVAAVPIADDRLGEKVCLVITATAPVDGAALLDFLSEAGLSKYDMPEFLAFTDQLPLGPTGKILKRELVLWLRDGRLSPQAVRFRAKEVPA